MMACMAGCVCVAGGMCGRGTHVVGHMHGRVYVCGREHTWQGACLAPGHVHGRGACMAGGCACMTGETATVAGGTHPTGMHSC